MKQFSVPDWVSFHTYKDKNNWLRVYISNEYTHEFFAFDEITAELWDLISTDKFSSKANEFIKKYELEDEINDFLSELISLGLIVSNEDHKELRINTRAGSTAKDEDVSTQFQSEMRSWLIQNGYLSRLFLELTYKCNLKCLHCFNDKDIPTKQIKFEDIKHSIDEAYDLGIFNVTISGGECTLDDDFLKIAKYIRSKKISLDIFTNGQTLYDNEKLFNELIKLYPYRISLSLYSMNDEIHDKITGVIGSCKKTKYVIEKLLKNNIPVEIKCFLTKYNADSYVDIREYATKIGASLTLACVFVNNPKRNNSDVQVTDEQLYKIYSDDKSLLKVKRAKDINYSEHQNQKICMGGHNGLCIDPSLDIYTCPTLKIPLGNIKTTSIKTIWNDKDKNSELTKIRKLRNKDLKDCFKHEYCKHCFYCLGTALSDGQYLNKYESFCRHAKIKMECE